MQMLDYVISTFYPEIQATHASDSVQRHAAFFREVGGSCPPGGRRWVPGPRGNFSDTAEGRGPGTDPRSLLEQHRGATWGAWEGVRAGGCWASRVGPVFTVAPDTHPWPLHFSQNS